MGTIRKIINRIVFCTGKPKSATITWFGVFRINGLTCIMEAIPGRCNAVFQSEIIAITPAVSALLEKKSTLTSLVGCDARFNCKHCADWEIIKTLWILSDTVDNRRTCEETIYWIKNNQKDDDAEVILLTLKTHFKTLNEQFWRRT